MKLIGLDLSLTATGHATFNGTLSFGTSPVSFGTIAPKKLTGLTRMRWIRAQIGEVVKGADLVVVEDFGFSSRGSYVTENGGLGWLIRDYLSALGIPFILVAPSQTKKFATGKGNAEKNIVIREVWRRFEHEAGDDNQADAITLVYIGRAIIGDWKPTAEFQSEVVKVVLERHQHLAAEVSNLRAASALGRA